MGEICPKALEEIEQIEKDRNGIMAIFKQPPTEATSLFVGMVTAFVNSERTILEKEKENGW